MINAFLFMMLLPVIFGLFCIAMKNMIDYMIERWTR